MRKSNRFTTLAAAVLGICVWTAQVSWAQEQVINGGFEEPVVSFGNDGLFDSIPGWSLCSGPKIEIQNHCCGSPFDGQQHVELDSTAPSAICQSIPTVPGQKYRLEFAYSPRPGYADNRINVLWDGQTLTQLSGDGTNLTNTDWRVFHFFVLASGASTVLEFQDASAADGVGGFIDGVSVLPPAPAPTVSLGGLGLVALAMLGFGFVRVQRARR